MEGESKLSADRKEPARSTVPPTVLVGIAAVTLLVLVGGIAARSREVFSVISATIGGAVVVMLWSLFWLARISRAQTRANVYLRDAEDRLRRALGAELAASETRARAVLDTTASAIVSIDAQGVVETFNQAAERLFGHTAAEMIGQNVSRLMPEPHRGQHDAYIRRYLDTGERRIIGIGREVIGLRKDGTTVPIALTVTATPLQGRPFFTAAIRDLSQEKAAEEREHRLLRQALQNERLADIGAMTARIAHDFGNPLAGLSMTAQRMLRLLARDPPPVDRLTQAAETVLATTRHLDALVAEFKEFTREQRLNLQDIAVPAFLQEVVTVWQQEAGERGITLEIAAGDRPPTIHGDHDKLRRVLDNLVKNALEAIDRGPGVVRLTVESSERGKLVISVADSGPGIPAGTDVFALFETTKPTGTGLGLAICRQIVLAHGGGIEYAAAQPAGTVFRMELPIHGPAGRL
jgi:two-component system sensor kinase FixL